MSGIRMRYLMVAGVLLCAVGLVWAQSGPKPPTFSARSGPSVKKVNAGGPGSSRASRTPAGMTRSATSKKRSGGSSSSKTVRNDLRLNFQTTPLEIVLQDYSEKTGKTLLRAPGLPSPMITLRSQGMLSLDEYLSAIETVLSMNGVGLVPTGEKFVRVVPIAEVVSNQGEIRDNVTEGLLDDNTGRLVNQMIMLKHIDINEATKAIQPLLHKYGKIIPFERTNSIMVTDEVGNINRVMQVLRMIDQPIDAREEPRIIQIRYAKAGDIKQKLEEIIAESQKQQNKSTVARTRSSGAPGYVRSPSGVIRARTTRTAAPKQIAELVKEAERGIIRGTVKIVADERTNKLIIITRPENMTFFEKIIAVLDVETAPDVTVKVVRLEFAEAKKVESMLNDLIGANKKEEAPVAPPGGASATEGSKALKAYVDSLKKASGSSKKKSSVGELSKEHIKILSDERTNALVIMASKADLATLLDIVSDMDMMLSQVLIESVIIDVKLGGTIDTGVTWIQHALIGYDTDSAGVRSPVAAFRGKAGGTLLTNRGDATGDSSESLPSGGGLGYFLTLYNLNLSAVIKAVSTDTRTKVISTPILLTTDNTEAKLSATEKVYVYRGTPTYYGGSSVSRGDVQYDQQDIGLELTVTPHINENKVVMMEINQKISEPGDQTGVDPKNLSGKTISRDREIDASIAVRSGQTIVLGGQVRDGKKRARTKVPILGDIPLLGRLFSSDSSSKARTETIVFITPYVLDTPEEVSMATKHRRDAISIDGMWTKGWSDSELASDPKKRWWQRKPKPKTTRREFSWETSGGKSARGYKQELDHSDSTPEKVRPAIKDGDIDKDVDEFLQEQRKKWDNTLNGA